MGESPPSFTQRDAKENPILLSTVTPLVFEAGVRAVRRASMTDGAGGADTTPDAAAVASTSWTAASSRM
jgi:hypothetical protein